MRAVLSACCPERLIRLLDAELFEGPNCHAGWPSIHFTVETGADLPSLAQVHERLRPVFPSAFGDLGHAPHTLPAATIQLVELIGRIANGFVTTTFPFAAGWVAERKSEYRAACSVRIYDGIPGILILQVALVAIGRALTGTPLNTAERQAIDRLRNFCDRRRVNSESAMLIRAAEERTIPFLQIAGERDLWQFGWGAHSRLFWAHSSNGDGAFAHLTSRDKHLSKDLFRTLGLPTPPGGIVRAGEDFRPAARIAGWPCVVKPLDRGGGRGVSAGIRTPDELKTAIAIARAIAPDIIIESHVPGLDHRLVVIDGRLAMAARRDPPSVTGDGTSSIGDLIEMLNAARISEKANGLKPVVVDAALDATLASQSLDRGSVLAPGTVAVLRRNANHATGGTFSDVLGIVHPQIERCAVALARGAGFRLVGLDYLTTDISRSYEEVGGAFIEMNATPTLGAFVSGDAAPPEIGCWALGYIPSRIPVCLLIIPAESEQEVAALLEDAIAPHIGIAAAGWTRIGTYSTPKSGLSAVARVVSLLRDPSVSALAILWTAEDLCRFGLPVDAVDRVVMEEDAVPSHWRKMLARHSKRISTARSPVEFAASAGQFLAGAPRPSPKLAK